MSTTMGHCGVCGQAMHDDSSDLCGGPWDLSICPHCGRRRVLADGGVALNLSALPEGSRFELGEIHIRPGAVHVLSEAGDHYWQYLARHTRGDVGDFRGEGKAASARASFLSGSGNIVSAYRTSLGKRLWIMTTPGKLTSVMVPGEY